MELELLNIIEYVKKLLKTEQQPNIVNNKIFNTNNDMIRNIFHESAHNIQISEINFAASIQYDDIQSKFINSQNKMFLLCVFYCINKEFNKFTEETQIYLVNKTIDKFFNELKTRNNKKYYCELIKKQILLKHILTSEFSNIFIYFIAAYLNINIFIINNYNNQFNIVHYTLNKTYNHYKQSIILWTNNNLFYPIKINDNYIFCYNNIIFKNFLNNDIHVFDIDEYLKIDEHNLIFNDNTNIKNIDLTLLKKFNILYDNDIEIIYQFKKKQFSDTELSTIEYKEGNIKYIDLTTINEVNIKLSNINNIIKNINDLKDKINCINLSLSNNKNTEFLSNNKNIETLSSNNKNIDPLVTEQVLDDIMICVNYTKNELDKMKMIELKKIMKENNLSLSYNENNKNKLKTKHMIIDELLEL